MLGWHRLLDDAWGWELPGGIVDLDEGSASTAAREVEEETGWRPGSLKHLPTQDEVAVVARNHPDRHATGRQRRHDRAQHPSRLHVMRLVTVPQRRPCILAGVVAPHHCGSVRTEHNGEDVRAGITVDDRGMRA